MRLLSLKSAIIVYHYRRRNAISPLHLLRRHAGRGGVIIVRRYCYRLRWLVFASYRQQPFSRVFARCHFAAIRIRICHAEESSADSAAMPPLTYDEID